MRFSIEFYETAAGRPVVQEELDDVEQRNPVLFDLLVAGFAKLRYREYHRPPLCMPLGNGLFELRAGDKDIARAAWFFQSGGRIVVVHIFEKKTPKTPKAALDLARRRMADYLARHRPH
jgi:hypothetical protein